MMKLIHMEALSWMLALRVSGRAVGSRRPRCYSSPSTTWGWSVRKPDGGVV
jgi:hypothetical protein